MHIDPEGHPILTLLHESSSTVAYRAEREEARRPALLELLPRGASSRRALARYRRELDALPTLRIPGVVEILAVDTAQGVPMPVIEDSGGEPLAWLRRTQRLPLDCARVLALASRVAAILAELHERGVTHGGVHPSNILLAPGTDELAHFGDNLQISDDTSDDRRAPAAALTTSTSTCASSAPAAASSPLPWARAITPGSSRSPPGSTAASRSSRPCARSSRA